MKGIPKCSQTNYFCKQLRVICCLMTSQLLSRDSITKQSRRILYSGVIIIISSSKFPEQDRINIIYKTNVFHGSAVCCTNSFSETINDHRLKITDILITYTEILYNPSTSSTLTEYGKHLSKHMFSNSDVCEYQCMPDS